ncbi:lymphocyte antigen 6E-like [Pseudophryne corroboree]|uniref:lymphocyte antigen 6E-like n=1 Tax=Pseudophryne corroboree TaxID=495146 RepID=UPI0030821C95
MAAYITSVLLLAALCIGTASSLTCYTCAAQSSNANCLTSQTNCTSGVGYCETSVSYVGIGSLSTSTITKTCAAVCTSVGFNALVASTSVSCCSADLCNTSGGSNIKYNFTAIALALGFIFLKNYIV